jgi:hypothetical protein
MVDVAIMGERQGHAVGGEVRAPDGVGAIVLLLGFGSVGVGG